MTDQAEAQELCRWLRAWCVRPNTPRGARRRVERFHRWADTVDALSARLAQECALRAQAEQERDMLREEKGAAEVLLGELGAGGSAAGLVPAIHNLASRAERAERSVMRMAENARAVLASKTGASGERSDSASAAGGREA